MNTIDSRQFMLPPNYPKAREILLTDFPSLGHDLPIRGGWGYGMEDAVIIDRNDPAAQYYPLFDYVSMEYTFVEKRLYEELIISRERGKGYSGIEWNLERQSLLSDQGREYDELVFSVTMFADKDWDFLKTDWESHRGYSGDRLGLEEHEKKRESLLLGMTESFLFDITSCR